LQDKKTPKPSLGEGSHIEYLSPSQNNLLLFFACLLTIFPPLFYVSVAPGSFDEGFGAMRILNGELKYVSFLFIASPLIGLFGIFVHFRRRLLAFERGMLVCLVLFLGGVLLSTVTAHNIERAWVATLKWHLLPLLLAFTLAHVRWNRYRTFTFLGVALGVACVSSYLVLDQHYGFTEWATDLPRNGINLGALLYNQNMAAEYHVPFLPIALGLLFYTRSLAFRAILFLLLAFFLLPALTLSLARGAWMGLLVAGVVVVTSVGVWLFLRRDRLGEFFRPCLFRALAFLALTLALPIYIYTTPYWKKSDESGQVVAPQKEAKELASIIPNEEDGTINRRFLLWQDAFVASFKPFSFWGHGTDHYELFFHQSAKLSDNPPKSKLVRYVHNDYIQTLYENGPLCLLGFLGLWGFVLWRGLRSALSCALEGDAAGFAFRLGLLLAAMAFLVTMFFQFPSRMPASVVTGWSVFGLLLAFSLKTSPEASSPAISLGPKFAFFIGAFGLFLIPYGILLAKDLLYADIYHQQGLMVVRAKRSDRIDKSLRFHRASIAHAPWQHRSRKWECFLLLQHLKRYPEALESADQTLAVHPGCLSAHRYRIGVLYKYLRRRPEALAAFQELEKAAPYHPVLDKERKKFHNLK
jgi:O-antigen ligase